MPWLYGSMFNVHLHLFVIELCRFPPFSLCPCNVLWILLLPSIVHERHAHFIYVCVLMARWRCFLLCIMYDAIIQTNTKTTKTNSDDNGPSQFFVVSGIQCTIRYTLLIGVLHLILDVLFPRHNAYISICYYVDCAAGNCCCSLNFTCLPFNFRKW